MNDSDAVAIWKTTQTPGWPLVMKLADDLVTQIVKDALAGSRDYVDDSLAVGRGGVTFLNKFQKEIAGVAARFEQSSPEPSLLSDQPLEIL